MPFAVREWWADTSVADRERHLDAALHDRAGGVRRAAMLVAGQMGEASAEDMLLQFLRRQDVELRVLPPLPADEMDGAEGDAPSPGDPVADAGVAALALGYLRSERTRPLLEAATGAEPSPMPRVALALYGACERLSGEDFDTPDHNQARQLAAVEAVARCSGRSHLADALRYEQATHWWEPEFVAHELRDALLAAGAPGSNELRAASSLEDLRAWYARHGEEYLASRVARPDP